MRARDSFSFDDGISTSSWNAVFAFRRRVSMSAIGSVIMSAPPASRPASPRCLGHAGHFACVRHGAEADAAEPEALVDRARAAATATPRVPAHLELRSALLLLDKGFLRHVFLTPGSARRGGTGIPEPAGVRGPGRRWCPW